MKRVLALTLLAAFAAGPSVKWLCQHSCAAGHPVAATEDCHNSGDSEPTMVAGHHCDHAAPVALTAKRIQPDSHFFVSTQVAVPPSGSGHWPVPSFVDVAEFAASPPLASCVVPLRI